MRRTLLVVSGLCLLLAGAGCSRKKDVAAERAKVAGLLSKEAPKPQHTLDVRFGEHVTLIGYDLSADKVELGKPFTVTWHFKVDKALDSGWREFTHLADGNDRSRINADRNGQLRQNWDPSLWEAGTYVKDPQTYTLPEDWKSDKLVVYLGFYEGNERLPIKGRSDGNGRARALEVPVAGALPEPPPELVSARATGDIKLDGKLDEPVWTGAATTNALVNTMTGAAVEWRTTVKSAWDDKNLYVAFDVGDDFLKSTFEKQDDHLWEQDCVEIMVDPDGDGKNYFELQVSPANKSFDTRYDARRVPKPFGHVDWNAGLASGVSLKGKGKLNDTDADEGYVAEIAIPWTAFAAGEPKHEAPKAGESWRVNFYVMDARDKGLRAAGWSPPRVGDFHVPRKFGKLVFTGAPTEAASEKKAEAEKAEPKKAEAEKAEPKKAAEKKPEPKPKG